MIEIAGNFKKYVWKNVYNLRNETFEKSPKLANASWNAYRNVYFYEMAHNFCQWWKKKNPGGCRVVCLVTFLFQSWSCYNGTIETERTVWNRSILAFMLLKVCKASLLRREWKSVSLNKLHHFGLHFEHSLEQVLKKLKFLVFAMEN